MVPAGPCPVNVVGAGSGDHWNISGEHVLSDRSGGRTSTFGKRAPEASIDHGRVPLRVEARARVDLERVPRTLDADGWLGEEIGRDGRAMRRLASDLVLGVGTDRPVAFHKSMIVGLGQPQGDATGWAVPIEWQAASLTPLFPVFVGHVRVDPDGVAIVGHYAPPFGIIGVVLDRALLGIAARATAKVILGRFVEVLTRP